MKLTAWEFIIIMTGVVFVILYWTQRSYYLRKKNRTITFVVRFKNGITHYIDLPENITKDKLIECAIRINDEEEANIVGIYNIFGDELEYIKGVWVEK